MLILKCTLKNIIKKELLEIVTNATYIAHEYIKKTRVL
jgi:hypothetical protein